MKAQLSTFHVSEHTYPMEMPVLTAGSGADTGQTGHRGVLFDNHNIGG